MYRFGAIDAVPKKRGPKTDVLEALLKRVDGLEAQLKEKKEQPTTPTTESAPLAAAVSTPTRSAGAQGDDESGEKQTAAESTDPKAQPAHAAVEASHAAESSELAVYTPSSNRCARPIPNSDHANTIVRFARQQLIDCICSAPSPAAIQPDVLLDTYFARFHAKPFYILDESSVRQRLQLHQLPNYLVHAIYAVAARCVRPTGFSTCSNPIPY